ncbi:MAG: ABC transporter permease [Thermoanaerobaculia bacterium]
MTPAASGFLAIVVLLSAPLVLAAAGELILEKSGSIQIGLEGTMLVGAFTTFAFGFRGASPTIALLMGGVAGALFGFLFALFAVWRRADPILVGTAWNLLALGLTAFSYRIVAGVTGSVLQVATLHAFAFGLPLAVLAVYLVPFALDAFLRFTRPGLILAAAGENPEAVHALGISVVRIRSAASVFSGLAAGLAGGLLVVTVSPTFVEGLTAGRGFLALSLVVFCRWKPLGLIPAGLLLGCATALQYRLQAGGSGDTPYALFLALPGLLSLGALALFSSSSRGGAPRALGTPAP